jgi:hypothetical protein
MRHNTLKTKQDVIQARAEVCGDGCPFWELIVIESNKGYCIFCGEKCYKGDVCKAVNRKAIKRTLQ